MTKDLKDKKFVTIGNGTGQAAILKYLSGCIDDITVIVGVTDNGGHSGQLRKIMNMPAPGDIRNCLSAISNPDSLMSKLINYRFTKGELAGLSLGNFILCALTEIEGDMGKAVNLLKDEMNINAKIIPASVESTEICAELEDGKIIQGEFEIIRRQNNEIKIINMFHNPQINAYEPCVEAIKNADVIIISPGTLRTGIISTLLARGIKEAIIESSAKLVFICNIMTNPGQTEDFSTLDHIEEITKYLGRKPDYALVHSGKIPAFIQDIYIKERSYPVKHINVDDKNIRIIMEDLLEEIDEREIFKFQRIAENNIRVTPHLIRHNSRKVSEIILKIAKS